MGPMAPRPMLPPDDLYARLELPVDASFEAVEVAWRALLKRHHPDVAGATVESDDRAKRINVAHDWLSDPDLRARYDRERHPRRARPGGSAAPSRRSTGPGTSGPPRRRPPVDADEALARHLDRIERLTPDEIDRLTLAESPPIAFVASIARFLSPERISAIETVEQRVHERLPRTVRWNAAVRDAAVGYAQELVLGPFLDEHLSWPFRERVRERLARGWEAAVDQPRYGPNSAAVAAAIERLHALGPADLHALRPPGERGGRGEPPWPKGFRPDEDDALRVSSELARRDATGALPKGTPSATRRSLGRAIHAVVLRHAFPVAAFDELVGPWRDALGVTGRPRPSVRSDRRPRG